MERHRSNVAVVTLHSACKYLWAGKINIVDKWKSGYNQLKVGNFSEKIYLQIQQFEESTFKSKTFCPVSTLNCITFMSPEPEQPHMILKIYSWLVTIRRIFISPSIQEIIVFYVMISTCEDVLIVKESG